MGISGGGGEQSVIIPSLFLIYRKLDNMDKQICLFATIGTT